MSAYTVDIRIVARTLENGVRVAEALLFPEVFCCGEGEGKVAGMVQEAVRKLGEATATYQMAQRQMPGEPLLSVVEVTLVPPLRSKAWEEPLELKFDLVRWRHGEEGWVGRVPALGIEVVARNEEELEKLVPEHILFALRRTKMAESLFKLALTQRSEGAEVWREEVVLGVKTPKQVEQDAEKDEPKKPVIRDVGVVLDEQKTLRPAYEVDDVVERLAEALVGRNPRSVLIVGPGGVGKTAVVHELVRQRKRFQLGETPFWSTSGSRLIAGMSGFGMWQQRTRRLCVEAGKERAVLHLGNLVELMEVGKVGGGQGIAGFLRPYLVRGEVLAIAEATPEQLPLIERANPQLLAAFHVLRMEEPDVEKGRMILRQVTIAAGGTLAPGALETMDRLHRRYATYSAYPGRPVRFLENLLKDRMGKPVDAREVTAAFARETGLPLFMLDEEVPLDLAESREWFASRVIGQREAVDLVTDLLATVKSALNRPRRPIASLLFIGPTGVGKTEMAKSLAEFFFGDRARMVRFDMSEYATPMAVARLVGGAWEAEGLLTAKVREQPFCVVLLDEFEKAHPLFFDLLLQVLGEGRLTDSSGRVADFSNAIVVMTSNLGAESYQRGRFGLGKGGGVPDPREHFSEEVRGFLRPEMFNRIDRIVPFGPLDAETILKVARREIALIGTRDGIRGRGVELEVSDAAVRKVAAKGYDPRYGARPLKRAMEREVLVPLADAINQYAEGTRLEARVDAADGGALSVEVKAKVTAAGAVARTLPSESGYAVTAEALMRLRRKVQALLRSPSILGLRNEVYTIQRVLTHHEAKRDEVGAAAHRQRLKKPAALLGEVESFDDMVVALEDRFLAALYEGSEELPVLATDFSPLSRHWPALLLKVYAHGFPEADRTLIGVYGDAGDRWRPLARGYVDAAKQWGYRVNLWWFGRRGNDQFLRHECSDIDEFFDEARPGVLGIAMTIEGTHAALRFNAERGVHLFTDDKAGRSDPCLVDASDVGLAKYVPPAGVEKRGGIPAGPVRRAYDLERGTFEDAALHWIDAFDWKNLSAMLVRLMDAQLNEAAKRVIE